MCDSEHEKQIRNWRTENWLCQLALGAGRDEIYAAIKGAVE